MADTWSLLGIMGVCLLVPGVIGFIGTMLLTGPTERARRVCSVFGVICILALLLILVGVVGRLLT